MKEWLFLIAGCSLPVLLLAVAHWLFRNLPRRLPRLWAYRIGVFCLWTGFALWRLLLGDWQTPLGLGMICLVGGSAVTAFYWLDDLLDAIGAAMNKADKGDFLMERMLDDDGTT